MKKELEEELEDPVTQKMIRRRHIANGEWNVPETPMPVSLPGVTQEAEVAYKRVIPAPSRFTSPTDSAKARLIEEQSRSFCLSLFFRECAPIRSLGITSSISGEGKSFVAIMMARLLANDSTRPVILIECDWEQPSLHDYFGVSPTPGLAEWLRGECTEEDIRYKVNNNLTVIRAGYGRNDAVKLLQQIMKRGLLTMFAHNDDNLLVDLPPVMTTAYGIFAARMPEALALVVRAGATPDNLIADACTRLNNLPVEGIILNQVKHRVGVDHQ